MLDNVPVIIKIARITIIAGILFGVIISIISSATFSCSVNSYSDYEYITWISSIVNSSISILVCILIVYWLRNAYKTITYNAHVLNLFLYSNLAYWINSIYYLFNSIFTNPNQPMFSLPIQLLGFVSIITFTVCIITMCSSLIHMLRHKSTDYYFQTSVILVYPIKIQHSELPISDIHVTSETIHV